MTTNVLLLWGQFVGCAVVIAIAGSRLSRYGEIIGQLTGWGGQWVGLILLATVTSLPELATGISAVTTLQEPDLAIGDVLGSCVFNLGVLAVLDVLYRGKSIYSVASQDHLLPAGFNLVLIGTAGLALQLPDRFAMWSFGHVGLYTPLLILLYLFAMQAIFQFENRAMKLPTLVTRYQTPAVLLHRIIARYVIAACLVVVAGYWLAALGKQLALLHGWHASFVGTLFIAGGTSLPELVVTIAALRLGALDMAIANLLGSNLFDMLILAIDDLFFLSGPILAHVTPLHAISGLSALIMTGLFMIGLIVRHQVVRNGWPSWVSMMLVVVYLANSLLLFWAGEANS